MTITPAALSEPSSNESDTPASASDACRTAPMGGADVVAWHRRLCEVTPRIWISGDLHESDDRAVEQLAAWTAAGITHVLDCRDEWTDVTLVAKHAPQITYLELGTHDDGTEQDGAWFDTGVAWIRRALSDPTANVLVFCHMGVNRSPSLVFAALLAAGWSPLDALERIIAARPIAAVLYAVDALVWHHARTGPNGPERRGVELGAVEAWVDAREGHAAAVVGRLRTSLLLDWEVKRLSCADLAVAAGEAGTLTESDANSFLDCVEECLIDIWEAGDAVQFPVEEPFDALDRDKDPDIEPGRVVAWRDLAGKVAARCELPVSAAEVILDRLADVIKSAYDEGQIVELPVVGDVGLDGVIEAARLQNRRAGVARLRGVNADVWLFQINIATFDLFNATGNAADLASLTISQHRDKVQVGDIVVLWVAGKHAGVYGIGQLTSVPYEGEADPAHVVNRKAATWNWLVDVDMFVDLYDEPVMRNDLKDDPRFVKQSIITRPVGRNPFRVDGPAFEAILERAEAWS